MNVQFISDLHIDINGKIELPGGDVLIVAGDVCEARSLSKEFHSTKLSPYTGGSFPCYDFFYFECAKYKKVYYVLGNHEYYGGKYWKVRNELEKILPDHVQILDNNYEEYNGVIFVGSTLWSDMNKSDPLTLEFMKGYMNDYRMITYYYPEHNVYHKMRPVDAVKLHFEAKKYINDIVTKYKDKSIVVITHMGPTYLSINEKYKTDRIGNGGFVSDLSDLILDNPDIKIWVHGHVHDPVDYMVGDHTRVICNPRGYLPFEARNGFSLSKSFEV